MLSQVYAKRHREICGNPADIVFITDSSYSIYPKWFYENQLGFLRDMVNEFNIKPDGSGTRIGVIVFGDADKTKIEFNLKDHFAKEDLLKAIDKLKQLGGNTYTNVALKLMRERAFTRQNGARIGEVPQIAIVMTDGRSDYPKKTAAEALISQSAPFNITMIAVGIGKKISSKEIRALASEPKEKNAFTVSGYQALDTIKEDLAIQACKVKCNVWTECGEEPVDVAFVLGETTTRNAESTKQALEFVNGLTSSLNIAEDKVQVALVPKECKNPGFHFNKFSDNDGVAGYLEGYKPMKQDTASRLKYTSVNTFSTKNGHRTGARKVAVVILDGPSANPKAQRMVAKAMKANGVQMLAIGVGNTVSKRELVGITGRKNAVIQVADYSELSPKLKRALYRPICKDRYEYDPEDECDQPDDEED